MNISFSQSQIKVFIATMIATFIMVALQLSGIKPLRIVAPVPEKTDTFFDVITPKLERVENTYSLHEEIDLLPKANAAAEYDDASAYAVIDLESGKVLAEKNLTKRLSIASITKVMTAIVALDLAEPSERFTVSKQAAAKIPTKIVVKPGEQLTLEELLEASLMASANDATEVIKEGIDAKYGEEIFLRAMNEKALLLDLEGTSFANAQGFDDSANYSTVEDLAILSHYALKHYPLISEIAGKDQSVLPEDSYHGEFEFYNWNGLIGVYPNVTGLKIGNTEAAGKTTVVVSEREGKSMLAIVLGAPGIVERDLWAAALLDEGYQTSMGFTPVNVTEEELRAKYRSWY